MSYRKLLTYFFGLVIIGIITLTLIQANKPITIKTPYLYLVQELDSTHDTLIRTNDGGVSRDTIFSGRNIQGFNVNGSKLLISEGLKYQTTRLRLVDMITNVIQEIDFKDHYIDTIYKLKEDFIFIFENINDSYRDYRGQIGILRTATNKIEVINPQSLATDVSQLYVNPSGTLAVFTGFNSFKFLIDLENFENIKKFDKDYSYTSGFVDDSRIIIADYNNAEFFVRNVSDNTDEKLSIEGKNFQDILGKNNQYYYSYKDSDKDKDTIKFRKLNATINSNSFMSYEKPVLEPKGQYFAIAVYNKDENKIIQDVNQREFITPAIHILDTSKNTFFESNLRAKKFSF
jgi:hypothetical protein